MSESFLIDCELHPRGDEVMFIIGDGEVLARLRGYSIQPKERAAADRRDAVAWRRHQVVQILKTGVAPTTSEEPHD